MGANASTPNPPTNESAPATCPVDHKARAAWLAQNQGSAPHPLPPPDTIGARSTDSSSAAQQPTTDSHSSRNYRPLSLDREISSIPRAFPQEQQKPQQSRDASPSPYAQQASTASHQSPSNNESETGHDPNTGNWIYPSEKQFFDALVRKNSATSASSPSDLATSVASIIPIHNAVNERAWSEILSWESRAPSTDPGSRKCGGPRLYSFRGLGVESQFLSPRARFNGLLGYQLPFDRHDWVVERCGGERIEYVIDFYQGRSGGETGLNRPRDGKLSFYLDVRPKLNTFEGWRMRANRLFG